MGRPAFFWGDTPRGTLTPRGRMSSPSRVRPQSAEESTSCQDKQAGTPEGMGPALSPLLPPRQKQGQTYIYKNSNASTIHYRKTRRASSQISARQPNSQERFPGGGEEAARPNSPPLRNASADSLRWLGRLVNFLVCRRSLPY